WNADAFLDRLKEGDQLIQATDEGKKRIMVSPPARVIYVRCYKKGRSNRAMIYVESARGVRRKNQKEVVERTGPQVKKLCNGNSAKLVRDWPLTHALLNV